MINSGLLFKVNGVSYAIVSYECYVNVRLHFNEVERFDYNYFTFLNFPL